MGVGDIPREMVLDMMDKYKREQQEKPMLLAQLAEQLTHSQEIETDIGEWVSLIQDSKDIERLDRELLIKLWRKLWSGKNPWWME